MAQIANVFGRLEAFSLSIFVYIIGYIQMAGSQNVQTYASAQIFYSAGSTGLQILQQIFIADTSDLLNRALWSSLPDLPFLVTVWVGPEIGQSIYDHTTWRWGYGLWAIVLPIAFLPLALSLFLNKRKAAKMGLLPASPFRGQSVSTIAKNLSHDLDFFGLLLLSAAISLILIPLTLAAKAKGGWKNGSIIAMLVIGVICLLAFPFWETNKKLAPRPIVTLHLLKNRTVLAGCGIAFFYFMAFYLSIQPYFYSYLQVVQNHSITAAGHITQIFSFTSTISSIIVSLIIRRTAHYKYFVITGVCIYTLGLGLIIRYRVQGSSTTQIVFTQIIVGLGGGMLNVPTQLGVQASASHTEVAAATAIFLTVLEIGGAVGSAISGAIWTANIPKKLRLYLPVESRDKAEMIFASIVTAQSFEMGTLERRAINRAYQETMSVLLVCAVCVCLPLFPLALCMRNYKLDEISQNVKGKVIGQSTPHQPHQPTANTSNTSPFSDNDTSNPEDNNPSSSPPPPPTTTKTIPSLWNRFLGTQKNK
ncbi:MAG: hypothetical protein M1812_006620 [Candelaria pacifica]|nr:MAG: hypothetical protein M1812_006620 [Candelaria pacifica]